MASRKRWSGAQATVDERVSVLIHEMEESTRALRIPPFRGQGVEVGDFGLVDRASYMARIRRVGVGGKGADGRCGWYGRIDGGAD